MNTPVEDIVILMRNQIGKDYSEAILAVALHELEEENFTSQHRNKLEIVE